MTPTPCPTCGADLVIREVEIPATGGQPARVWTRAEPCAACADRRAIAYAADEARINRAKWSKPSRSGIEDACQVLSLDPAVMTRIGLVTDPENAEPLEVLREWVAGDWSLYVHGAPGTGKSTAAMAAAMDCLRKPDEVLYLSEARILDIYRTQARGGDVDMLSRAKSVPVLVLDDVGRHKLDRGTAFLPEVYFDILDVRCPAFGPKHKTLITSQLSLQRFAAAFNDEAIARRVLALVEGAFIEMIGDDRSRVHWTRRRPGGRVG